MRCEERVANRPPVRATALSEDLGRLKWCGRGRLVLTLELHVLLLTMFAQKQIVAGLTAGAVKGS
jgi:hypothetical protein